MEEERKQAPKLELPAEDGRVTVCDIRFRSGCKIYYFDPNGLTMKPGDHVIIDTARGQEYGICSAGPHRIPERDVVPPLRQVLRLATEQDERINRENEQKEKKAFQVCQQKIEDLGLDMQLVSAECAFDGSKLLFFFTADARVDFRELVKILASTFRTRIELRQIGVRDKARMVGGFGICGRPFCCAEFLEDFSPVSVKMAKTQNLSPNPAKISGTCGRLMCCLRYEQEAYEDLLKTSPRSESLVDTPEGRGTVTEVNLMRQSVKVRMEQDPEEIKCFRNCDVCVLRSGKAKKTDPPIPADLAPISGKGPRPKEEQLPEEPALVTPVLRSELAQTPVKEPETRPERRDRYRRRQDRPAPKAQEKPTPKAPEKKPAVPAKTQEEAPQEQKPKNKKKRFYYRKKK